MGEFKDTLKKYFYGTGASKASRTAQVCLLSATGEPIGSDSIGHVGNLVDVDDSLVDMGLPSGTLWCKHNLGGAKETDYGWYVSWGNVELHQEGAGYDFSQATYNATAAVAIDGNLILSQDAAHVAMGGKWRMPTREQFEELLNASYTTNEWVTNYNNSGVNGRLVTSIINGNTLFFPAAGWIHAGTHGALGSEGSYFTNTPYSNSYVWQGNFTSTISFRVSNGSLRGAGLVVRPVQ